MKRAALVVAVLGMCGLSFGQNKAAQSAPAAGQAAAAPQGKRMPAAKTQPEFDAFNAARQLPDAAASEKAADDFATKFPDSELRAMLFKSAMQKYQQANNGDKMIEMGHKALSLDPDDPEALVAVAQGLAEGTHDADLDRDQKLEEAKKNAERALETVDTDVPVTGAPAEQLAAFKGFVRSEAYFVVGTVAFKGSKWADAETSLKKSIDAFPQQPDTIAVFRLAVALDMQNKVADGLKYANQAVDLTKDHPDSPVGKAARAEQDRLTKLSSGTAPGGAPQKK